MKLRVKDQLADFGCTTDIQEFRTVLGALKHELYPDLTDEDLAFSRHEVENYCKQVREKVGGSRLPRVFTLKQLCNLRKIGKKGKMERAAGVEPNIASPVPLEPCAQSAT